MIRTWAVGVCIACVVALAGCGGGSSGVALTNEISQLQPFDQWDYVITGTIYDGTQSEAQELNGSSTMIMTPETVETPTQEMASVMLLSRELVGDDFAQSDTERIYLTQDPDGTIWIWGGEDDSGSFWFDVPYKLVQSPLGYNVSWYTHVESTQQKEYDDYYIVVGSDRLDLPAGRFETYHVVCNGRAEGSSASAGYWWSPSVGLYTQRTETTLSSGGLVMELTYRLAAAH